MSDCKNIEELGKLIYLRIRDGHDDKAHKMLSQEERNHLTRGGTFLLLVKRIRNQDGPTILEVTELLESNYSLIKFFDGFKK